MVNARPKPNCAGIDQIHLDLVSSRRLPITNNHWLLTSPTASVSPVNLTLTILLVLFGLALRVYVVLAWLFPPLIRPFFWLIVHSVMRFRVYETSNLPKTGGGLIVSNHVTYFDWLLLWVASPRRVRFVLWEGFYRNPFFRFMLSFARHRTIRVDNSRGRAHAIIESLDRIAEHLRQGELVVLFPEQTLTRNGQMLPFGRGPRTGDETTSRQHPDHPDAPRQPLGFDLQLASWQAHLQMAT